MDLRKKVALVTGAGHRIGKAVALALASGGADVAVHYGRNAREAEETAAEIAGLGVESWPISADLSRAEEIDRLFQSLRDRFGRLDVLVNSAASFHRRNFDSIDAAEWDSVMTLNLRAPFLCSQRAAALMRESERGDAVPGSIVNLADLSGLQIWMGYPHHSVSKAGLLHLTRVAARELAPEVRVNALIPGAILPPPGVDVGSTEWSRRGERVPLGRTGDAQDVGRAVVFLVESDFITGALLPIDGGEHLVGAS